MEPDPGQSRRNFLKTCRLVLGTAATHRQSFWADNDNAKAQHASHLVRFGRTELFVTRLSQGTAFRQVTREPNDPEAQRILKYCLDIGVNFFDTSEAYGWGGSEIALGKAIAGRRDRVVICSKASPGTQTGRCREKRKSDLHS